MKKYVAELRNRTSEADDTFLVIEASSLEDATTTAMKECDETRFSIGLIAEEKEFLQQQPHWKGFTGNNENEVHKGPKRIEGDDNGVYLVYSCGKEEDHYDHWIIVRGWQLASLVAFNPESADYEENWDLTENIERSVIKRIFGIDYCPSEPCVIDLGVNKVVFVYEKEQDEVQTK